MKMLLCTAQTLPLYVGKSPGAKAPPLCGAVPAESTYIAKVSSAPGSRKVRVFDDKCSLEKSIFFGLMLQ